MLLLMMYSQKAINQSVVLSSFGACLYSVMAVKYLLKKGIGQWAK